LEEHGSILEQGSFGSLGLQPGYLQNLLIAEKQATELIIENLAGGQDTVKKSIKATAAKEIDQQKDLTRRTGDVQVYKYYIKSIGWKHITALFVLMAVAEFCLYFPRKRT
jgi:ATP-binding cassette subfamily C (CFTR/MRP) protein 1